MDITVQPHEVAHAAAKCIPQIKNVIHNIGVTKLSAVLWASGSLIVGSIVGYFVGKRGLTGTKNDLTNAVTTTEAVATEVKTVV